MISPILQVLSKDPATKVHHHKRYPNPLELRRTLARQSCTDRGSDALLGEDELTVIACPRWELACCVVCGPSSSGNAMSISKGESVV